MTARRNRHNFRLNPFTFTSSSSLTAPLTCRSIRRASLVSGIFLAILVLTGCAPELSSPVDAGASPVYGTYWYGKNDANQLAIPGELNPYYNPTRPTILFVHGWQPDQAYTHRTMLWEFEAEASGEMVTLDLAAPWIDAGWNLGVFDWGPFADESFVFDAEAKIWTTEGGQGMRWRDEAGAYHAQVGRASALASFSIKVTSRHCPISPVPNCVWLAIRWATRWQ